MIKYNKINLSFLITILFLVGFSSIRCLNKTSNPAYLTFGKTVSDIADNDPDWYLAIYMDVNACISCCEDMEAWQELEEKIPYCGGALSLWTPRKDSIDVAVAMRLEGMKTTVRVLNDSMVKALNWKDVRTPVKVIFDTAYKPVKVIEPFSGGIVAKQFYENLLIRKCNDTH